MQGELSKLHTHVLFFNMIRPWIHLTSDFRRVLSSVIFSRKWLGWHKWITHTKYHQIILILTHNCTGSHANPEIIGFPWWILICSACLSRRNLQLAQEQLTTYCRDQYKRFFQLVPGLDSREICGWCFEVAEEKLQSIITVIKLGYITPLMFAIYSNLLCKFVWKIGFTSQNGNFDREHGDGPVILGIPLLRKTHTGYHM
jgi:hypothetical protein